AEPALDLVNFHVSSPLRGCVPPHPRPLSPSWERGGEWGRSLPLLVLRTSPTPGRIERTIAYRLSFTAGVSPMLLDRRSALATLAGLDLSAADVPSLDDAPKPKGNVKQSICRWCYGKISLDKLCEIAKKLGYRSIELLGDKEVLEVNKAGLSCAVMRCASIADGLNRKTNHDRIEKELTTNV